MNATSASGPSCHPYLPAKWWWQRRKQEKEILNQVALCSPVTWKEGGRYSVMFRWGLVEVKANPWRWGGCTVSGLPFAVGHEDAFSLWRRLSDAEHIHHDAAGCLFYGPSCPDSEMEAL